MKELMGAAIRGPPDCECSEPGFAVRKERARPYEVRSGMRRGRSSGDGRNEVEDSSPVVIPAREAWRARDLPRQTIDPRRRADSGFLGELAKLLGKETAAAERSGAVGGTCQRPCRFNNSCPLGCL